MTISPPKEFHRRQHRTKVRIALVIFTMALALTSCGSSDRQTPVVSSVDVPGDSNSLAEQETETVAEVQETVPTASALEVAEAAYRLYEDGDIEGWFALWAPDATWQQNAGADNEEFELFGTDGLFIFARQADIVDWDSSGEITISDMESRTLAEFHASGGLWNVECSSDDGTRVTCSLDPVTTFGPWTQRKVQGVLNQRAHPATAVLTITEGTIERMELTYESLDIATLTDRQVRKQAYRTWLIETHADESVELVGGSVDELLFTPDNRLRHRELIADWAAQQ